MRREGGRRIQRQHDRNSTSIAIKIFYFILSHILLFRTPFLFYFRLFLTGEVKLSRALSEPSSLNNLRVPAVKTTLLLTRRRSCIPGSPHVFRTNAARMQIHARTLPASPWIFDNPNWIPLLGTRRRFSTVLALHRSRLSCKIVFPRKLRIRLPSSALRRSVGNAWRTNLSLVRLFFLTR